MLLRNKKCLVTGGTGMIGRALVDSLLRKGNEITTVSLDKENIPGTKNVILDLRNFKDCVDVAKGHDFIFHLAGIKGSPKLTATKPASFFVNTTMFNTNMLEAIFRAKPEWALYTSSVGVYAPAEVFKEDGMWDTLPSPYDKFAGWAKRMGELQIEAYKIEHNWNKFSIIRPSNVFGAYDNFDLDTCMVVPATIRKVIEADEQITVWGDGSPIRDFVYSKQVSDQMIFMVENEISEPLNCGSGDPISIKEMVETVIKQVGKTLNIIWDTNKPSGDKYRTMDMSKAASYGFKPTYPFEIGIRETINWYLQEYIAPSEGRYNAFKEKK